jgi:DNA-binding CsgD family transcriptional regulator
VSASDSQDVNEAYVTRPISIGDVTNMAAWIAREFPVTKELLAALPSLLLTLISEDVLRGAVVEHIRGTAKRRTLVAFGLCAFLTDEFAEQYLASPYPHLELDLLDLARKDSKSAFLGYDEIAKANASGGLTVFPLMWLQRSSDPDASETRTLLMASQQSFMSIHRGYRISRILKETTADRAEIYEGGGFRERSRIAKGVAHRFTGRLLKQEHVIFEAKRSDVERSLPGTMISHLFAYRPPRCGFTRAEKQILERAVTHRTDAEIAAELGISATAVALRWRLIYERLASGFPASLMRESNATSGRGKEKRRRAIAFIQDHPEEMRPFTSVGSSVGQLSEC